MNANESAYPCPVGHIECAHPTGLTKRELIAAMAMQGLLSANSTYYSQSGTRWGCLASDAVQHADALILELSKDQPK